jgi:hypothetical protein
MSDFVIKENHKFGCLSINTRVSNDLTEPLQTDESTWFLFKPPFPMSDTWTKWLGTIQAEKFLKNDFFIFATQPSASISMLDHENKALETRVTQIFYSLLLHGVARCNEGGFLFSGANNGKEISIRTNSSLIAHQRIIHARPKPIDKNIITKALRISRVLGGLCNIPDSYLRFKRGFDKYLRGLREPFASDRLHQFVRAIEAIIKPEIGRTKKQFIHRCQTFICRSQTLSNLLGEIFDLRSNVEHLNDIYEILGTYAEKERDRIAFLRAFQVELIAEYIYLKIFESQTLLDFFKDEDTIESFWQKPDHERFNLWGEPLDIEVTANSRFQYLKNPANH